MMKKYMNYMLRVVYAAAAGVLLFSACAEEKEGSYAETEKLALHAWMKANRPELVGNYQAEGDYYVDVLDLGATNTNPINDTARWVSFTFTGRNLAGDIVVTRDEIDAKQVGTYTNFTHYVPYFKYYANEKNTSLLEGTYLAMHNKLTLDKEYADARGYPTEVEMRYGTKVTLYMPSSVVSSNGMSGSGGYEGQAGYELKAGTPFIVTMQITDMVKNPLTRENLIVENFAVDNGKLKPKDVKPNPLPDDPYDGRFAWRHADTTSKYKYDYLYVDLIYTPTTKFTYPSLYKSVYAPYDNFAQLEQNICDTLVNRFGVYDGPKKLKSDSISTGSAKIWYIGRFMDGFIFDSNIPGVRRLIYGETSTEGTAMTFKSTSDNLIQAFQIAIPNFRYGQWACILTTSTYAYGVAGVAGKTNTSTTSSNNYDMLNYYNAQNNYFGYNGYYNYPNYNYNPGTTTTTTSISTEIPAFTPLLFQLYIEPEKKK